MKLSKKVISTTVGVSAIAIMAAIGIPVMANSDDSAGTKLSSDSLAYKLNTSHYEGSIDGVNAWYPNKNGLSPDAWNGNYGKANDLAKQWTPVGANGHSGKTLKVGDGDYEAYAYLASITKKYIEEGDQGKVNIILTAMDVLAEVPLDENQANVYSENSTAISQIIEIAKDQAGPYTTHYSISGDRIDKYYEYSLSDFHIKTASGSIFDDNAIETVFTDDPKENSAGVKIVVDKGSATLPADPEDPNGNEIKTLLEWGPNYAGGMKPVINLYHDALSCSPNAAGITVSYTNLPSSSILEAPATKQTDADGIVAPLIQLGATEKNRTMNLSPCKDDSPIKMVNIAHAGNEDNVWREITPATEGFIENIYTEVNLTGLTPGEKYTAKITIQDFKTKETIVENSYDFNFGDSGSFQVFRFTTPIKDKLGSYANDFIALPVITDSKGNIVANGFDYGNEDLIIKRMPTLTSSNFESFNEKGTRNIEIMGYPGDGVSYSDFIISKATLENGFTVDNPYDISFVAIDSEGKEIAESERERFVWDGQPVTIEGNISLDDVQNLAGKTFEIKAKIYELNGMPYNTLSKPDTNTFTVQYLHENPGFYEGIDIEKIKQEAALAYSSFIYDVMSIDGEKSKNIIDGKSEENLAEVMNTENLILPEGEKEKTEVLTHLAKAGWFGNKKNTVVEVPVSAIALSEDKKTASIDTEAVKTTFDGIEINVFNENKVAVTSLDEAWKAAPTAHDFLEGPAPVIENNNGGDTGNGENLPEPKDDNVVGGSSDNRPGVTVVNDIDETVSVQTTPAPGTTGHESLSKTGATVAGIGAVVLILLGLGGILLYVNKRKSI